MSRFPLFLVLSEIAANSCPFCPRPHPSHFATNKKKLICTTEEGEILLADWRARVGTSTNREEEVAGGGAGGNDDGGDVAPEFVKWVSSDHTRPCVALDKSPFFPGVLLSVGDWSFQIWKVQKFIWGGGDINQFIPLHWAIVK